MSGHALTSTFGRFGLDLRPAPVTPSEQVAVFTHFPAAGGAADLQVGVFESERDAEEYATVALSPANAGTAKTRISRARNVVLLVFPKASTSDRRNASRAMRALGRG